MIDGLDISDVMALEPLMLDVINDKNANKFIDVTEDAALLRSVLPGHFGDYVVSGNSAEGAYIGYSGSRVVTWLDFGGFLAASGGRRNTQDRTPHEHSRYLYPVVFSTIQGMADGVAAGLAAELG